QRLAALPDNTLIYCTHEYTLSNLRFAQAVEPHNTAIAERLAGVTALRAAGHISLPSTLALEHATNPFLRANEPAVKQQAEAHDQCQHTNALAVFTSLRSWKNSF
ncbi:MAG: hydroxyacylglutathione hydrolase, partial [Pseudomonas sp. PGPPP3]